MEIPEILGVEVSGTCPSLTRAQSGPVGATSSHPCRTKIDIQAEVSNFPFVVPRTHPCDEKISLFRPRCHRLSPDIDSIEPVDYLCNIVCFAAVFICSMQAINYIRISLINISLCRGFSSLINNYYRSRSTLWFRECIVYV